MTNISNDVYKETYYALTENDSLLKNIPSNVLSFIRKHSKSSTKTFEFFNDERSIPQLSKKALELYTYLLIKYGNVSETDKNRIKQIIIQNSTDKADLVVDNLENYLDNEIQNDIVEQVKIDSEKAVNEYLSKDDIGFEDELYLEMKKRLEELNIEWEPFPRDILQ